MSLAGCLPDPAPPPKQPAKPAPAAAPSEKPAPGMVREKAEVGVGKRGRDYQPGMVTTPVQAYFRTKERVAFDIQIPHAMQLYKATEGHAPKTHAEFMEKIIKENAVKLPDLPDGHRYVYDPKTEELTVEHPE
jgi:hypothetical protein